MKGSKLYSVMHGKCPVCQEGDVFKSKQIYNLRKFDKMHERCPACNHKFEIEQGFWYGAMYVSYGFTVVLSLTTFLITYLIYPEASAGLYIALICGAVIFAVPVTYRMSRLVWMNLFTRFDPLKSKKYEQV